MNPGWKGLLLGLLLSMLLGAAIPLATGEWRWLQASQAAPGSAARRLTPTAGVAPQPATSAAPARPTSTPISTSAPTSAAIPVDGTASARELPSTPRAATLAPLAASPSPAVAAAFRTLFDERFADNRRQWPNNPQATAWFAEGAYHLFVRRPSRFVAVAPIAVPFRDVVVTGMFRKIGGPPGGGFGLILRDEGPGPRDGINQDGRFYVFEAGDRGEVGIWRRDGDRWIDLLPWTRSDAVRPGGAANELTARAAGETLSFLVNGTQVATLQDSGLRQGGVGVFVGGDLNEVVLEQFTVHVPS